MKNMGKNFYILNIIFDKNISFFIKTITKFVIIFIDVYYSGILSGINKYY